MKTMTSLASLLLISYLFWKKKFWIHDQRHELIGFKMLVTALCVSTCLSTTLLLLLLEQAAIIFSRGKKPITNRFTKLFIAIELTGMIAIATFGAISELGQDYQVLHCMEDTPTIMPLVNAVSTLVLTVDTITVVTSLLICAFSHWRLQRRSRSIGPSVGTGSATLKGAYALRYSDMVVKTLLPVVLIHTTIIYIFNIFSIIQRSFIAQISDYVTRKSYQGLGNILPYYTLLCPILYVWALGKLRKRREAEFNGVKSPLLDGKIAPASEVYRKGLEAAWK
ncbi:unnamed protein product, partial [Mesorhabditis spiculigera]